MSQKQQLADLRQQLERWRSHNEVHAKPADKMLYEFLSDLLKIEEYEEPPVSPEEIPAIDEPVAADVTANAEGDEGGGDTPPAPDIP